MTIKLLNKVLSFGLSFTLFILLTACGDASDSTQLSPQSHKVTVTIGLNASSETMIGSVDLDVILPEGFILETDSSGQPTTSALSFLIGGDDAYADATYFPTTDTIDAGIIKDSGFAGDANLIQLSRIYPANVILPTGKDFTVTIAGYVFNEDKIVNLPEKISLSIELAP